MPSHQETIYAEPRREIARAPDRLYHDAVHEAGRVAISRVLGLPSAYVMPEHQEQTTGHAFIFDALQAEWNCLHPERNGDDRAFRRRRIIAEMAGAEAEREIIGSCAEEHDHPQWVFGYSDDRPVLSARMHVFARRLVKRHRDTILRLADQLVVANEICELLAR